MVRYKTTVRKLSSLSSKFSGADYAQWLISQFDLAECAKSSFGKRFSRMYHHPVQYHSAEELLLETAIKRCWEIINSVEVEEEGFDPTSADDDFMWAFGKDPFDTLALLNHLDDEEQGILLLAYWHKKNWFRDTIKKTGKCPISLGYAYRQGELVPLCVRFRLILQSNSSELLTSVCNRVLEIYNEATEVHRYLAAQWPDAAADYKSRQSDQQQLVGPVTLPEKSFWRGDSDQEMGGPVPLPKKIRSYCVLRSPHVNKDSREQFEIREHSKLIDFLFPTALTFELLNQLDIPSGVTLITRVIHPFEVKSDSVF